MDFRAAQRVKLCWAAKRSLTLASVVRMSQYATAYPRRAPCTVYPSQNPYDAERVVREPSGLRSSKISAAPQFLWRMGNRNNHLSLGGWIYLSKEHGTLFFECESIFHENVRTVQGYERSLLYVYTYAAGARVPNRGSVRRLEHNGPISYTKPSTHVRAQFGRLLICCWSSPYTVDTAGHPTPGPFKFWSVDSKVAMRACWSALELPVGKGAAMGGLLIMWPAATFAFSACDDEGERIGEHIGFEYMNGCERRGRTAMNWSRGGGHEHGIRIGWPLGPLMPSQFLLRRKVS